MGKVIGRFKVAKHFRLHITDEAFSYERDAAGIAAEAKARTKRTTDGLPVHSFQTLPSDLSTITRNTVQFNIPGAPTFEKVTQPTPLQQRALDLLGVGL